ncbi:hypothetical protein, partial [Streptomyces sp. NPDC001919]
VRVDDIDELLDVARVFESDRRPTGTPHPRRLSRGPLIGFPFSRTHSWAGAIPGPGFSARPPFRIPPAGYAAAPCVFS